MCNNWAPLFHKAKWLDYQFGENLAHYIQNKSSLEHTVERFTTCTLHIRENYVENKNNTVFYTDTVYGTLSEHKQLILTCDFSTLDAQFAATAGCDVVQVAVVIDAVTDMSVTDVAAEACETACCSSGPF